MVTEAKEGNPLAGPAERMQEVRDLKDQITTLTNDPEEQKEIIIRETSPRTRRYPVYSMTDGQEIMIPVKLLELCLSKRDPQTGRYVFTSKKAEAPVFKRGEVKCFLHPDAPDRVILDGIGLDTATCRKATLNNTYGKRIHAMHRHKQEWAMYQEYLEEQRQEKYDQRAERQLEATMELAKQAAKTKSV